MSAFGIGVILGQLVGAAAAGPTSDVFSLSGRVGGLVRSVPTRGPAIDLDTGIVALLALNGPRSSWTFGYLPRFSYLDMTGDRDLALMHSGRIGTTWSFSRRVTLTLSLDGSVGSQSAVNYLTAIRPFDFTTPTLTLTPTVQPPTTVGYVPQVSVLSIATVRGTVGVLTMLSRRWSLSTSGYYSESSGLDNASKLAIPPNRAGGGDVVTGYILTRSDQIGTHVGGAYVDVPSSGADGLTVNVGETYSHAWSPRTQGNVGAGVVFVDSRVNTITPASRGVSGTAQVNLTHSEPLEGDANLGVRGGAQLGTSYNAAVGLVQQTVSATLGSSWARARTSITATVDATASLPFDGPEASRLVSAGIVFAHAPFELIQFQLGARAYAQLLPSLVATANGGEALGPAPTYPPQWVVFAAVTLAAPPLEL